MGNDVGIVPQSRRNHHHKGITLIVDSRIRPPALIVVVMTADSCVLYYHIDFEVIVHTVGLPLCRVA
jgi:hypothetical protein